MQVSKYDYLLDKLGRRVEKTYATYGSSGWEEQTRLRFVYDAWNVVLVLDGRENNAIVRKYTWGLDLSGLSGQQEAREGADGVHGAGWIGGLLAAEEPQGQGDPKRYWFFYDGNGNVGQVLDATDEQNIALAAWYEYDAYGNAVVSTGAYAAADPIRYSTKWLDGELAGPAVSVAVGPTGLYDFGRRPYSPRLGRWISRDPQGEEDGANLYQSVKNRPTVLVDLWGLYTWCDSLGCVDIDPTPPGGGVDPSPPLPTPPVPDPDPDPAPDPPGDGLPRPSWRDCMPKCTKAGLVVGAGCVGATLATPIPGDEVIAAGTVVCQVCIAGISALVTYTIYELITDTLYVPPAPKRKKPKECSCMCIRPDPSHPGQNDGPHYVGKMSPSACTSYPYSPPGIAGRFSRCWCK